MADIENIKIDGVDPNPDTGQTAADKINAAIQKLNGFGETTTHNPATAIPFSDLKGRQIGTPDAPSALTAFTVDVANAKAGASLVIFSNASQLPTFSNIVDYDFTGGNYVANQLNVMVLQRLTTSWMLTNLPTVTIETITGLVEAPGNGVINVFIKAPYRFTVLETVTIAQSGTCTATFAINGTPLNGTPNAVSDVLDAQTHDADNVCEVDQVLTITTSSDSSCANMDYQITVARG